MEATAESERDKVVGDPLLVYGVVLRQDNVEKAEEGAIVDVPDISNEDLALFCGLWFPEGPPMRPWRKLFCIDVCSKAHVVTGGDDRRWLWMRCRRLKRVRTACN